RMRSTRASASPPASTRSPPTTAARRSPACSPAPRSPPRQGQPRNGCSRPRRRRFFPGLSSSFGGGPKDRARNLEIPGSMLRIAPGMTDSVADRFVEIKPLWVLDQSNLPALLPLFELLLAGDGRYWIVIDFEPHQSGDVVLGGEAPDGLGSMLVDSSNKIFRYANISCPVLSAR